MHILTFIKKWIFQKRIALRSIRSLLKNICIGVVQIKQFAFIIFILFLAVGIGAIFIITNEKKPTSSTETNTKKQIPIVTELEEQTPRKETDPSAEVVENKPNSGDEVVREQVKEFIVESVKGAIDFFFNKETKIVAIGDSLTQGVGDRTGKGGYVGILDRSLNETESIVQFDNYGKRGNRSDQLLKRLDEPEISASLKKADIVLITIGANDIMQVFKENFTNLTLREFEHERLQYENRLEMIFTKVRDINPTISIYLLGFYNPFDKYFKDIKELNMIVDGWNRTGEQVTQAFDQSYFIPTNDLFNDKTVHLLAEDNFHPNYLGYQRIAERVLTYLTEREGDMHEKQTE
ncbi:SGNH/GDSL hydrolase family protein [Virgibacillus sp. W0430]|uniref:SGNH/GDSL hydrolase family protein n=1 Tax=Virgibacillus sp. W0430 TaxID=3391580 RepID=UPI003F48DC76